MPSSLPVSRTHRPPINPPPANRSLWRFLSESIGMLNRASISLVANLSLVGREKRSSRRLSTSFRQKTSPPVDRQAYMFLWAERTLQIRLQFGKSKYPSASPSAIVFAITS
jgi:hypothetical protein